MKKLILVCILLAAIVTVTGCTGNTATPAAAWAGIEVLNYNVQDADGQNLGTMTTTIRRKATEGFSNVLEDRTYNNADCRMEMETDTASYNIKTTVLSKGMYTLAIKKVFTDKLDASKGYVWSGYHEGKRLVYSINGGQTKKLNVGSSGYTDNEFLYMYLRCYTIENVPSALNVADPIGGTVTKLSTSYQTQAKAFDAIPYPGETRAAICNKVTISLAETPKGKGITVYYTPDEAAYNVDSFKESATTTRKIPVMIVENDITYVLTGMFVA